MLNPIFVLNLSRVTVINNDVALQKFKNTIAVEDYLHREFALSIDEAIAEYDCLLVYNSYDKTMDASLRAAIVRQTVKRINFAQYFKTLNRLAAYPYYDQVNEEQMYSSIADDIKKLTDLENFTIIQQTFTEKYTMNNYQTIISEALNYLNEVHKRRAQHD